MAPTKADMTPAPEKSWKFLVFYLCFYGFMVQMRPGESFITPYLLGPDQNFTQEQVTNEITPVLTYSYMAVLVPIFLLTDYLRYKPVLVLQSLSYLSVWMLLIFGTNLLSMQFMEFFFGITMAARVAYSSYIFSLVNPERYQRMASYSRSSVLLGVFTSSVLGQICITVGKVPFVTLHYISLGFMVFGLVLTLFLKRPRRSLFFNRPHDPVCNGASPSELDRMNPGEVKAPEGKPWWHFLAACRNLTLVRMLLELGDIARVPQLRLWSLWGSHLLCSGLCEDPLGSVVRAGDRGHHFPSGRAHPAHVYHQQHLGVLHVPGTLQRLSSVPGAHSHFPDCLVPDQGAVCPGVWGQHLPCHHPEDCGDCCCGRQKGPRAPRPLPVPGLPWLFHSAGCGLFLRGCVLGHEALSAEPAPGHPLGQ
ncbi:reduced folate transporter isoform X2 [Notamacropus eugenii]|uniref:reduced folate transporter isoform X2 n=1 Tax=Notamacropus eugenii TaxID=9315 RepID=UPI003B6851C6